MYGSSPIEMKWVSRGIRFWLYARWTIDRFDSNSIGNILTWVIKWDPFLYLSKILHPSFYAHRVQSRHGIFLSLLYAHVMYDHTKKHRNSLSRNVLLTRIETPLTWLLVAVFLWTLVIPSLNNLRFCGSKIISGRFQFES